jgi:hypothetical protein
MCSDIRTSNYRAGGASRREAMNRTWEPYPTRKDLVCSALEITLRFGTWLCEIHNYSQDESLAERLLAATEQ